MHLYSTFPQGEMFSVQSMLSLCLRFLPTTVHAQMEEHFEGLVSSSSAVFDIFLKDRGVMLVSCFCRLLFSVLLLSLN